MIKLKDLLLEGTVDTKVIAQDLLHTIKRATSSKTPKGFGTFGIAWDPKYNGVFILFDTPREIRHPDDYRDEYDDTGEINSAIEKWEDFTDAIFKVLQKFEKKYKGVEFGAMGSISGPGIKQGRQPRPSHI